MEPQKLLKSCIVPFGFASFQSRAASHLDRVTTKWDSLLAQSRTYLGEIMSRGTQEPLSRFEAFPAGLSGTGGETGSSDVPTGTTSMRTSCCLQTLNKNKTVSTRVMMGQQETCPLIASMIRPIFPSRRRSSTLRSRTRCSRSRTNAIRPYFPRVTRG
jgi:hypothetical protein